MNKEKEREAIFVLSNMDSIGPVTLRAMKNYADSYEEALNISISEYAKAGIPLNSRMRESFNENILNKEMLIDKYHNLQDKGIKMLTIIDEDYPDRLKNLEDPPIALYYIGKLPPNDMNKPLVSIIGARNCSEYGRSVAEFMSRELTKKGVGIVSGMAMGIDIAASEGAINAGGKTYCIMGTGADICYPKENYPVYRAITKGVWQGKSTNEGECGAVITEFPPGREALPKHFIMRNRLIAAYGDALIVIEARLKSGTATTVEFALKQGKEIFALPGRINDPLGQGCNALIRDGANILTEPGDVLSFLGIKSKGSTKTIEKKDVSSLNPVERKVYDALSLNPKHVEDIAIECKLNLRETLKALGSLELLAYAKCTMSAYYAREI